MKINPKYGDKIISIPATSVLEYLRDADEAELKVLIYVLANQNTTVTEIAKATGIESELIHDALSLWKKKGVISVTGLSKKTKKKSEENEESQPSESEEHIEDPTNERGEEAKTASKVVLMSSELPVYSTDQINRILEKNRETKALIDNCQQVLGKIMSVHEVEVILKLIDYLDLGHDFVLLLCTHCASIRKTSLRYIEKTAVSLFDAGITDYAGLEKYIESHTVAKSREGKMRNLLGIGERAFTKKEKDAFLQWASWNIPMDVITKAFEITAENTKKFSISYMNAILERWHKEGLSTVQDVEKALESYKKTKSAPKEKNTDSGSFTTEDFFEAALQRSYSAAGASSPTDNN